MNHPIANFIKYEFDNKMRALRLVKEQRFDKDKINMFY